MTKLPTTYATPAEEYAAVYEELQLCREAGQGQAAGILSARLRALGEGLFEPLPATRGRLAKRALRSKKLARDLRHPARLLWGLRWSR